MINRFYKESQFTCMNLHFMLVNSDRLVFIRFNIHCSVALPKIVSISKRTISIHKNQGHSRIKIGDVRAHLLTQF